MTDSMITEDGRPADGVVQRLARDDVERKKFLKMAGRGKGAGVAATGLAAFIAACGSSSSSSSWPSSSASSSAAAAGTSSSTSEGSGDLAIVNYALTLEYLEAQFYSEVGKSGLFHGKTLSLLKLTNAAALEAAGPLIRK
jgi:Ferritin-like domain